MKIIKIRRLVRSGEDFTWIELLEHLGISEMEYLEYGSIWRDIGAAGNFSKNSVYTLQFTMLKANENFKDDSASLRQKDQFIYLDDLKELCEKTRHIFKVKF